MDAAAVRNTRDVDILLRRDDLEAATTALTLVGFVYRRVVSLGQPRAQDIFLDGPEASAREAVHIVLAGEKVRPDSLLPAPDVTEAEDADAFRLVSLPALVRMKLTSFRDKDRTHLRDLIELGLVDAGWLGRLQVELQPRLRDLLDDPEN